MKFLLFLLLGASTLAAPIGNPAGAGAMGSTLSLTPEGVPLLSWLEPAGADAWAMRFSAFDPARQAWGETRTVAQGANFFTNWADFPQLAAGHDGRLTAVWFVNNPSHHAAAGEGHHGPGYRAVYAMSGDGGKTWSPELPVSDESLRVEFVALQPLPDGRMLAAWLDGRNHGRMALYARVLDGRPGPGPDTLVDSSVCDCCQLSFAPTADGGALLAYRGRTTDEIRDIRLARFDGKAWQAPTALNHDGWKIPGCPVNGPQLAAQGDRLGAVWFTGADGRARVLARVTDRKGDNPGPVTPIDLGRPQGRVDNVMLADGTLVLSWLEMTGKDSGKEGGIYLRTLSPDGRLAEPLLIAPSSTARMSGFPRLVGLGGRKLLLTCTTDATPSAVLTHLIDVP